MSDIIPKKNVFLTMKGPNEKKIEEIIIPPHLNNQEKVILLTLKILLQKGFEIKLERLDKFGIDVYTCYSEHLVLRFVNDRDGWRSEIKNLDTFDHWDETEQILSKFYCIKKKSFNIKKICELLVEYISNIEESHQCSDSGLSACRSR